MMHTPVHVTKAVVRQRLRRAREILRLGPPRAVLGRYACLGGTLLNRLKLDRLTENIQKGRIDFLLEALDKPSVRPKLFEISPYIAKPEIVTPLIEQQAAFRFDSLTHVRLIFFDSFSELTDQMFASRREKWRFLGNYSDFQHSASFKMRFEELGLMPVEHFYDLYLELFRSLRARFGSAPILFINFPAKLDQRRLFRARSDAIREALERVAAAIPDVHCLSVDEAVVDWGDDDRATRLQPYHYNEATYASFLQAIQATGVLQRVFPELANESFR